MFGKEIKNIMGKGEEEKKPSAAELLQTAKDKFKVNLSNAAAVYSKGMELGKTGNWEKTGELSNLQKDYLAQFGKEAKEGKTKKVAEKEPAEEKGVEIPAETEIAL